MKVSGHIEKWGTGVLGAVSLALLVNLLLQIWRMPAGHARPPAAPARGAKGIAASAGKTITPLSVKAANAPGDKTKASFRTAAAAGKPGASEDVSHFDPDLHLDLLKELEDRPLPELARNPFEFPRAPVKAGAAPAPAQTAAAAPQPPPPPPVTLKPMGYSEEGGVSEAMVSDEDQVYVVHAGDSVGTRYKIIKITPTVITVEDATLHQTVDLPIPQ
jgi:hypothetical protein